MPRGKRLRGYKSFEFRSDLFDKQGGLCPYCGRKMTFAPPGAVRLCNRDATMDHVVPRSKGGADDPDNLVLCCHECNIIKGDKMPDVARAAIASRYAKRYGYAVPGQVSPYPC